MHTVITARLHAEFLQQVQLTRSALYAFKNIYGDGGNDPEGKQQSQADQRFPFVVGVRITHECAGAEAAHDKPAPGHKIYPYLLRDLAIDRPNQVWAADITYVPIGRGFLYLVAVIDWASRAVLAWRLSNTMDAVLRCRAGGGAGALRQPEIFNTDQGSQFTSVAFTGTLAAAGIRISMDGRGRWMDNVFIERLWRSLKYEDIYLKGYADGREAKAGIAELDQFL